MSNFADLIIADGHGIMDIIAHGADFLVEQVFLVQCGAFKLSLFFFQFDFLCLQLCCVGFCLRTTQLSEWKEGWKAGLTLRIMPISFCFALMLALFCETS